MNKIKLFFKLMLPYYRRFIRLLAMPYCYISLVNWQECKKGRLAVFFDLWYIFLKMKSYPDFYSPCRLWEKDRESWTNYYGSIYDAYQRKKLSIEVTPPEYKIIFDDKRICHEFCESKNLPVPKSYGTIHPADNFRLQLTNIIDKNDLLKVIMKPLLGHAGMGILFANKINHDIFIHTADGEKFSIDTFNLQEPYIIQEIITQHSKIAQISPSSVNTIRFVTLLTKENNVLIVGALMRFSATNSLIDNWSAGGLAIGIDIDSGSLLEYAYDKHGNRFKEHPISRTSFNGIIIPNWTEALYLTKKAQLMFPYYKMLGLDMAISSNGPIIIEINSDPDNIMLEQTYGPILRKAEIRKAFGDYDLLLY